MDFTRCDPVSPRSVTRATAGAFDFVACSSDRTLVEGSGPRHDAEANGLVRGRIGRVTISCGIDDAAIRITGDLDADELPCDFLTSNEAFRGTVLSGRTTLDPRQGPRALREHGGPGG